MLPPPGLTLARPFPLPANLAIEGPEMQPCNSPKTTYILSRLSQLGALYNAHHIQLMRHSHDLQTLKQALPHQPHGIHAPAFNPANSAPYHKIQALELLIARSTKLLSATWSGISLLRKDLAVAEEEKTVLRNRVEKSEAMIAKDEEIIDLVPKLLEHFAKKRGKKRQTVQISEERIRRVKDLMRARVFDAGEGNAGEVDADGGRDVGTGTGTTPTAYDDHDATPDAEDKGKQSATDPEDHITLSPSAHGTKADHKVVPFSISLYTLSLLVLSDNNLDVKTTKPIFRGEKIDTAIHFQGLQEEFRQLRASARKLALGYGIGGEKIGFGVKVENLTLGSVKSFEIVEVDGNLGGEVEAEVVEAVRVWMEKVEREKMVGKVREMKIFAFPRAWEREAMTVLMFC
jgi:hypothetical protein